MTLDQFEILLSHNLLKTGTEFQARYRGTSIGGSPVLNARGSFTLTGIEKVPTGYILTGRSVVDGSPIRVDHTRVETIDGMNPERYALTYGVQRDGSVKRRKRAA